MMKVAADLGIEEQRARQILGLDETQGARMTKSEWKRIKVRLETIPVVIIPPSNRAQKRAAKHRRNKKKGKR
jgi:hypothetical protein